jgi:folate-binding protein YgfZ
MLEDRGVLSVSGADATSFLQGLLTNDVERLQQSEARYAALLTPQGKILFDMIVVRALNGDEPSYLIDCAAAQAPDLAKRLGFYKLRAKVAVENISDSMGVLAVWNGEPAMKPDLAFADPRHQTLGWRILVPEDLKQKVAGLIGADLVDSDAYEAHRIASGVPRGGLDFMYSDAFPHETNMDRLHGVDFDKGCYVGQEVVSRMQHRGTARTRIVRVTLEDFSPETGVAVLGGDKQLGTMGSTAGGHGLALVRIDRVADALDAGLPLTAGGLAIRLTDPNDVRTPPKQTVA